MSYSNIMTVPNLSTGDVNCNNCNATTVNTTNCNATTVTCTTCNASQYNTPTISCTNCTATTITCTTCNATTVTCTTCNATTVSCITFSLDHSQQSCQTATTTSATPTTIYSLVTTSNKTYTLDIIVQGYITSGALAGQSFCRKRTSCFNNTSGVLTNVADLESLSGGPVGTLLAAIGYSLSGQTVNIQVTGLASNTINWTSQIVTIF